jgi:hypothetical protein
VGRGGLRPLHDEERERVRRPARGWAARWFRYRRAAQAPVRLHFTNSDAAAVAAESGGGGGGRRLRTRRTAPSAAEGLHDVLAARPRA